MHKIETKEFLKRYWWILKKDKISWDNLMICCPFHKENNPSFWLVKNTYFDWKSFHCKWWCFTCHTKWLTLENFVAQLEWIKKFEALKLIKELMWFDDDSLFLNWRIEKDDFLYNWKEQKQTSFFTKEEYLNEFDTFSPHEYMLNRWFNLNSWLKFNIWYSENRKRIWIPLENEKWEIVSIIWRSIDKEINPKYLYINKEWFNIDKSHYLFNFNNINFDNNSVILVEWPLNSIMIDQFWYENTVAIMWSKISDEQYELLMSHFNEIILWLDNDEAWRDWTKDIIQRMKNDDRKIQKKLFKITSDKDANEMTKEEFEELYQNKEEIELIFYDKEKKKTYYTKNKKEDLNDKINNLKKLTL